MLHVSFPVFFLKKFHLVLQLLIELSGVHSLAIDDLLNLPQLLTCLLFEQVEPLVHPVFRIVQSLINEGFELVPDHLGHLSVAVLDVRFHVHVQQTIG